MAYTGAEIFMKMNSNCNTTQRLDAAQLASHRLEVVHREMADSLSNGQKSLNKFWKGDGAETASSGLTPLITTSTETADRLKNVRESMYEQNSAFHETRGALRPVSTERPDDSGLFDYTSIGASDAEKAAADWDTDTRHNIAQYDGYDRLTQANRGKVTVEYAPVDPSSGAGNVTTAQSAGSVSQPGGSGPYAGSGNGYNAPTSASGYSGGTGAPLAPPPPVNSPPPAPPPPQNQVPPAANWRPPQFGGTAPSQANPNQPPTNPGYRPPNSGYGNPGPRYNPGQGGFGPMGGSGFGPTGSGGGSGGFGPRGSTGGGYGGGGARGFGPTGGSPAPQPGMGRGTAAVPPGAENTPGRGGAPGSSGSAGGRGGAMGAPMGGGRGGRGGEDEEHERKITVPGDDPDSVFGGHYERTTPPVIGEHRNDD